MFDGLFQPMHLLVIFVIAVLVFGPKRLPELGKGLGDGIRALKEGLRDDSSKNTTPASTSSNASSTGADPSNKDKKV